VVPSAASNPGCVGASGRSYGKINLKNATSSGYATNPGRAYVAHSIGDALLAGGYLTHVPQDPFSQGSANLTNPNAADYVLIRACIATGVQQVGSRGTVFAVWTALENDPTSQEQANAVRYPGGREAGPTNLAATYVYDFAAQQTEWQSGAFYFKGFAVGNGVTKVAGLPCDNSAQPA
jgi:hypothetical protein